jgi:uncharacterized membrane protein
LDLDWLLWPYDALVSAWRGTLDTLRRDKRSRLGLLILVLAAALRLVQPDWYGSRLFHPDERWIFDKTAELHLWAEPGRTDAAGMQYGSLPLYTVSVAKDALHAATKMGEHRAAVLSGRVFTGLVDSLTVLATLLLAWRLAGAVPALLAALVLACAPLSIQLAHFFTVDPWLTLFSVLTLYASLRVKETRSLGWSAAAGVAYAAALASKSAGLPLLLPILLGHLWPLLEPGLGERKRKEWLKQAGLGLAVAAGATLVAFFVFMPWAFLNFKKFLANQTAQQDILVKGSPGGVPFVRQYWDTGFGFHLKNIALYYIGLPTGLLALLALPWLAWRAVRDSAAVLDQARAKAQPRGRAQAPNADGLWQRAFAPLLLLSWALPYFLIVGSSFAKFARYMLPLLPILAIALALALRWLGESRPRLAKGLQWAVVVFSLGHGLGYGLTYLQTHPWVAASQWAFDNVPAVTEDASVPGGRRPTRTLNEDWGDDLPVDVEGAANLRYEGLKGRPGQVNIVEWDSANKLQRLSRSLSEADVLFLADARAYGTYLRLPTRFPLTHSYYDLLFHDPARLGFELAHQASNPIRLFGVLPLPDSRIPAVPRWAWADESFTLYDRPHAFIFRRAQPMSAEAVRQVLLDRVAELGLSLDWQQGRSPEELHQAAQGGAAAAPAAAAPETVNPNFGRHRGSLTPLAHPVLTWWLLVTVLGWLALPLATRVFGAWPAGGYALSKALGVLLFGWLAYNLAWLKLLPFTQAGLWALLGALALLGTALLRRQRAEARAWFQAHKREIYFSEAIFAAAFLFFVVVRAYNPNIHDISGQGYFGGGEPLGMTYLSALARAVTFPAYDPWLTLHDSSYYYFGYVLAAALTKLSGFPTAVTYNLSLALFFSLALLSAFGLLRGLVARRWLAVGGAVMVALAGSLWTVGYLGIQMNRGAGILSAWFSHGFIWDPSRFPELVNGHILEFPYFSYLYSDLHPHNMAVPFSLLLLALLAAPFLSKQAGWRSVGATPGLALLWLGLTALGLDSQYAINTWSWPVFVALGAGALLVGPWAGKGLGWAGGLKAAAWGAGALGLALVVGRVLMHGFRHYFLQDGGTRLGTVVPHEWQMSAYIPLAYFLPGLVALAVLAGHRVREYGLTLRQPLGLDKLGRRDWFDKGLILAERLFERRPVPALLGSLFKLLVLGLLAWSVLKFAHQGVWALALGLGLACVGFFLLRGYSDGREAFLWMLGAFTCFLVAGSERWFVADRTNTLFKFWFNGWILMGVVFGAGMAYAFDKAEAALPSRKPARAKRARRLARPRLPLDTALPWIVGAALPLLFLAVAFWDARLMAQGGRFIASFVLYALLLLGLYLLALFFGGQPWHKAVLRGVWGGLLALGLLYPIGATGARLWRTSQFKDPQLNGTAFMADRDPRLGSDAKDYDRHDHALIEWLNANAPVTETVLEAPGIEMYKGFTRFAIYTGLPTLLGWDYQVGQQLANRAGGILAQRRQDAALIYTGGDEQAIALLKKYRVRWVVLGGIERRLYAGPGLQKFERIAAEAARSGDSVLYRFEWDQP